jgi:hypothetical protein
MIGIHYLPGLDQFTFHFSQFMKWIDKGFRLYSFHWGQMDEKIAIVKKTPSKLPSQWPILHYGFEWMESQALLLEDIIIDSLFEFDWRKTHKPTILVLATNIQLMTAREVCVCGLCVACTSPLRVQYVSDWIRERVRQGLSGQGSVWCSNEVPRLQVAPATPVSQLQHTHTHTHTDPRLHSALPQSVCRESQESTGGCAKSVLSESLNWTAHTRGQANTTGNTHTQGHSPCTYTV